MKRLTAAFAIGLTLSPLLYAEGAYAQRRAQAETPEQAAAEAERKAERQRRQQEQQAKAQAQAQAQAQQQQQAQQRQQAQAARAQQQEQNRQRQERQQAQAARTQQQQAGQAQNQAQDQAQQQNEQRRRTQEARRQQQQQQGQAQAQQQQQNAERRQAQEARRQQQQQQGQAQAQQQQQNAERREAQEARERRRAAAAAQAQSQARPERAGRPQRDADRPRARRDAADRAAKPNPRQDGAQRLARPARRDRAATAPVAAKPSRPRPGLATRPNRQPAAQQNRASRRIDAARSRQVRQEARQRRQAQQARRTFRLGGRTRVVVRAPRYTYPASYRYRAWRRGQRFPVALLLASWFLNDFVYYGLSPAPPGYRWVRYGPDAVLVNTSTYEVYDTDYGVFDDGEVAYGPDQADLPPIDPNLPQEFASGELQLARDGDDNAAACEAFYGDPDWQADIDDAWRDEDWNGVAAQVIEGGCESDLGYFLLGLSAEGLVLPQAAAAYYQRALDLYDSQNEDNCDAFSEDVCRGLNVGDEAAAGLERIYGGRQ